MMLFAKIGSHAGWYYRAQEIDDAICGVIKLAKAETNYDMFSDDADPVQVGIHHLPDEKIVWDHQGFHCGDDGDDFYDNIRAQIRCFAVIDATAPPRYKELEWDEESHSWI